MFSVTFTVVLAVLEREGAEEAALAGIRVSPLLKAGRRMMALEDQDTDELLERARSGDAWAAEQLLGRHRDRLRRMVHVRMDPRLASRMDPSDVVQDALVEAHRRLPDYLRRPTMGFYPWLRQLAWERLIQLHRQHIQARARSVTREQRIELDLPDRSAVELANCLLDSGTSPSRRMIREELRERVQGALNKLAPRDREILTLRYLEQLSTRETADVLGLSEGAVKMRHLRALERIRALLDEDLAEDER